jgi:hypothetical protein
LKIELSDDKIYINGKETGRPDLEVAVNQLAGMLGYQLTKSGTLGDLQPRSLGLAR